MHPLHMLALVSLVIPASGLAACPCPESQIGDGTCQALCNVASCKWDAGDCLPEMKAQFEPHGVCTMAAQHKGARLCAGPAQEKDTCLGASSSGDLPAGVCDESCALKRCLQDDSCSAVSFTRGSTGELTASTLVKSVDFRSSVGTGKECLVKPTKLACTDSCPTSNNGICEDGGSGNTAGSTCPHGTDCTDCGVRQARSALTAGFSEADLCWTASHDTFRLCSTGSTEQPLRSDSCRHSDSRGVIKSTDCDASCLVSICAAEASCSGIHVIEGDSLENYVQATLLWFIGAHEANGRYLPCFVKNSRILCADTCRNANDGFCNDNLTSNRTCSLGEDCGDCGPRAVQQASHLSHPVHKVVCRDSCPLWNRDGVCQDGGDASSSQLCSLGTDCSDCGERVELETATSPTTPAPPRVAFSVCNSHCQALSGDGVCDDGGEGSRTSLCGYGTDCADCGPRTPPFYSSVCEPAQADYVCPAKTLLCEGADRDGTFSLDICDLPCLMGRCFDAAECFGVLRTSTGRHALVKDVTGHGSQQCYVKGAGTPQGQVAATKSPAWGVMTINNYGSERNFHIWIAIAVAAGVLMSIAVGAVCYVKGAMEGVVPTREVGHRRMSRSSAISMSEFTETPRSVGHPESYYGGQVRFSLGTPPPHSEGGEDIGCFVGGQCRNASPPSILKAPTPVTHPDMEQPESF
eukprot:TRINITY_DN30149_c0_g2_i5.p1 TRINITY_DN30149_c0_g2~~TRINITY_DN30149_c0_g2_i5.p1  ORF type:complete len:692 (+),score=96.94 TRINITY_DN30149_c0_g2_i5:48-2123(+)